MKKLSALFLTVCFILIFFATPSLSSPKPIETDTAIKTKVIESYGKLPLSFIENQGQINKNVAYYLKGREATINFTKEGLIYDLASGPTSPSKETDPKDIRHLSFSLTPIGANKAVRLFSHDKLPGELNYLIGNDPKNWHTGIPLYKEIIYKDLYKGIDLKIYGTNHQMEYDFIVAPGADPGTITLGCDGIDALSVNKQGDLLIKTALGDIRHLKPLIYQEINGKRRILDGSYRVAKNRFGFKIKDYDTNYPLIIDPLTLSYSTYLGGNDKDHSVAIAVDASGNAYVTGETKSTNFPIKSAYQGTHGGGSYDVFVTKLNPAGNSLSYSTYLGGGGNETGYGIAVDASGNAYVTGITNSTDFPTLSAYQGTLGGGLSDAFVTKLNATGAALIYSTYLGGGGEDKAKAIAVDASGNAYVTGYISSTDFPTINAYQGTHGGGVFDVFVTKLGVSGNTLSYSTYLGGSSRDSGNGIAVDASSNVYITGESGSTDFPTLSAYQETFGGGTNDVFVTKLNPAGNSLSYSTYLGGSDSELGNAIAVDASGNTYVIGKTISEDFPILSAYQGTFGGGLSDVFVTKLDSNGQRLIYSTYLGGSDIEEPSDIAIDESGNAYITGATISTDFPTLSAYQGTHEGGVFDVFVTKLDVSGNTLSYSTYLGGSDSESGNGIAVDASGNTYVTGSTNSTDFSTLNAYQGTFGGGFSDVFVTKLGIREKYVWYVDGHVATSGNGTAWDEAFMTIQKAINAASTGNDIWVKKGTYSLSSQINVDKGVAIYGGFAGDETQRNQRDWANNVTTIDGQDSVYHCFYITSDATIDGFTITGGNADGDVPDYRGGGLYIYQSSPSITNCTISENTADYGGGIYNRESSPYITNCAFTANSANKNGGGMENYKSSPAINNCTISENSADYGGGMYNYQSTPTITDCAFSGNSANKKSGGGMYNNESSPTITNCTFTDNSAKYGGGTFNGNSSPTIINCIIYGNSATNYGGGIRNFESSSPTITNCILWANTAPDGPEIYNDDTSSPIINYCNIQGGYVGTGNINNDPLFVDPPNNDFHIQETSPCIDKGSNNATGIPNTDYEGDSRILDGDNDGTARVDIGADEYEYTSSVTADGDVAPLGNRDGKVDVGDALVALRFALCLETPTQKDIQHGDVAPLDASGLPNPDGQIKVGDALVILRKALGIISWEPTEISGIWGLYTTTTGETQEDGPMIMILLESDTTLSLETMDLDGTWITGTGTINGTQVSLSWEDKEKTVSLTGAVTNGAMSGTWTDTSGDSGTWRAERVLEIGEAEITFPETGDELIKIEEEFGFGSAVFYGTDTEQGPALPLTGFTITTTEGDCVVSLDDQERPKEITLGTMEVTFTYNLDDSFNYELEEDGVLIYNGAAISTGEEGQSGSRSRTRDIAPLSAVRYYGAVDSIRASHSRPGGGGYEFREFVNHLIADGISKNYKIPKTDPFVKKIQQNPQLVNLLNIVVMNQVLNNRLIKKYGKDKARESCQFLCDFTENLVTGSVNDIFHKELDGYYGGKDYDFDKDGFTENQGDCNDRNKKIKPGATEECNGIDDDCDGKVDVDAVDRKTYYADFDGDKYGDPRYPLKCCPPPPSGYVDDNTDCNDYNKKEHPGQVWLKNVDGDGYYDGNFIISCLRPQGYNLSLELTGTEIDCNDNDSSVHPGATEICDDGKENDCDKLVDCDDPDCANDPACPQCPRPGDPADWTQPCEGCCIPVGATCCNDGTGQFCPSHHPLCCPNGCCLSNYICCPNGCCPPDSPICCPDGCCPAN